MKSQGREIKKQGDEVREEVKKVRENWEKWDKFWKEEKEKVWGKLENIKKRQSETEGERGVNGEQSENRKGNFLSYFHSARTPPPQLWRWYPCTKFDRRNRVGK